MKILPQFTQDEAQHLFADEHSTDSDQVGETIENTAVITNMASVEAEEVRFLWEPYLPIGKLAMLDGHPGQGKSFLTLEWAARLSKGEALHPDSPVPPAPGDVLYLPAEDDLADTIRPRLDTLGADPSRIHVLADYCPVPGDDPQQYLNIQEWGPLEEAFRVVRPALVIVDPIAAYIGEQTNTFVDNQVRPTLARLQRLAATYDSALVCVRHLAKEQGRSAITAGQGSMGFIAAARSAMLVGQDPDDEARRIVAHSKCNVAQLGESLAFSIDDTGVHWQGASNLTADDLLAPRRQPATKRTEAEAFLRDLLADGRVASADVKAQAEDAGITDVTLRRAAKKLGVLRRPVGKAGAPGAQNWTWRLP